MNGWYLLALSGSFVLAAVLTPLLRLVAARLKMVDDPASAPNRKMHGRPIPLFGGAAIILASVTMWWILVHQGLLNSAAFPVKYVVGLSIAAGFILIGGGIDDRFRLRPWSQLLWGVLAIVAIGMAGIGVEFITNPFGGLLYLNQFNLEIVKIGHVPYYLTLWADLFTFLWIMGSMYTTKILDGIDGLVSGIGVIGSVIIFLLTLRPEVDQPAVALISLTVAGACAGFLLFNWHPASIFLGESGSLFIGFMLGALSIISGGKIATALLILGLPILDLAWVIFQRRFITHTSPFRTADRSHLHFRLLDAGLSVRQTVGLLYGVTLLFGLSTLYFSGRQKLYALAGVAAVMVALVLWIIRRTKNRPPIS